jgi:pSer/pThr/pTyr-binding forkhead associated (FHA) protein
MENSEQKSPDEITIPERGKDWEAFIQAGSSPYSTERLAVENEAEALAAENTVTNAVQHYFRGDLLLKHYESQTEFRISNKRLQQAFIIGRSDFNSGFVPDVNLARLDAREKTVSRRHATIRPHADLLVITDHASLNGTYLNSQRLIPQQAWILRNGDMLRVGKICLIVYFVYENEKGLPFSDSPSHSNR